MAQADIIYVVNSQDLLTVLEELKKRVVHCSRGGRVRIPDGTEIEFPIGQIVALLEPAWMTVCMLVYGDSGDDVTFEMDDTYPRVADLEGTNAYLVNLEFSLQLIGDVAIFQISDDGPTIAIDFIEQGMIANRFEECFFGIQNVSRIVFSEGEVDANLTSDAFTDLDLTQDDDDGFIDYNLIASVFSHARGTIFPVASAANATPARLSSAYQFDSMSFELTHDAHITTPNLLALFFLEENPNAKPKEVASHLLTNHDVEMGLEKIAWLREQLLKREPSCGCPCCPINPFWKARLPGALSNGKK
ncbi:hypothetical protein NHH03_27000 [Stieleria sp. TO1_6]|nr:hypothetical protein [Stieleria tagensis]